MFRSVRPVGEILFRVTHHCIISKGHVPSNADIFGTEYFLHESAFNLHETSKSGHQNRIVLKPLFRVV